MGRRYRNGPAQGRAGQGADIFQLCRNRRTIGKNQADQGKVRHRAAGNVANRLLKMKRISPPAIGRHFRIGLLRLIGHCRIKQQGAQLRRRCLGHGNFQFGLNTCICTGICPNTQAPAPKKAGGVECDQFGADGGLRAGAPGRQRQALRKINCPVGNIGILTVLALKLRHGGAEHVIADHRPGKIGFTAIRAAGDQAPLCARTVIGRGA